MSTRDRLPSPGRVSRSGARARARVGSRPSVVAAAAARCLPVVGGGGGGTGLRPGPPPRPSRVSARWPPSPRRDRPVPRPHPRAAIGAARGGGGGEASPRLSALPPVCSRLRGRGRSVSLARRRGWGGPCLSAARVSPASPPGASVLLGWGWGGLPPPPPPPPPRAPPVLGTSGPLRDAPVPPGACAVSGSPRSYLVDPASSICLSQRLSHACLSTHGWYSETANGSLNQLWFV